MPAGRLTPDPALLARAYARMRRDLAGVRTIGVTGTKGKTSTTEFIAQLMEASGLRTAVSTTESARIGTRYLEACEHLGQFVPFVTRCRRAGIECLIVELCSSGLRWNVHHGLDLDAAVLHQHRNRPHRRPRQRSQLRGGQAAPVSRSGPRARPVPAPSQS